MHYFTSVGNIKLLNYFQFPSHWAPYQTCTQVKHELKFRSVPFHSLFRWRCSVRTKWVSKILVLKYFWNWAISPWIIVNVPSLFFIYCCLFLVYKRFRNYKDLVSVQRIGYTQIILTVFLRCSRVKTIDAWIGHISALWIFI